MTAKHKCSTKVRGAYRDVSGSIYPCRRPATVQHNGKWYCWQHDPIRVEADAEKRRATDKAKMDRYTARWAHRARNAKLAALLTPELAALLEGLARVIDETGIASDVLSVTDKIERAYALAASIREALALEVNDES